jgi:hypothetical protein
VAFLKIVLGDTFFDRNDAFLGDAADAADADEDVFLCDTDAFLGDTDAFLGDTDAAADAVISFIIFLIFK